jgi:hypothetical protein
MLAVLVLGCWLLADLCKAQAQRPGRPTPPQVITQTEEVR